MSLGSMITVLARTLRAASHLRSLDHNSNKYQHCWLLLRNLN